MEKHLPGIDIKRNVYAIQTLLDRSGFYRINVFLFGASVGKNLVVGIVVGEHLGVFDFAFVMALLIVELAAYIEFDLQTLVVFQHRHNPFTLLDFEVAARLITVFSRIDKVFGGILEAAV